MYGTTFPGPAGEPGSAPSSDDGQGDYKPAYQKKPWEGGGNYQKKPWEDRGQGGDGYQKKPWDGNKKPFQRPVETDLSLYKPYAITGNPEAPQQIVDRLIFTVKKLEGLGYTMRTGGLDGLEDTLEKAVEKKEIHLPFRDFNKKQSKFTYVSDRAMAVAKMFFPNWDTMKKGVQLFLAKNARIILGQRVEAPALFFICWTEDGVESINDRTNRTGFTGHPIAIASALGIPIFNFGNPSAEQRLSAYLESINHVAK